MDTHAAAEDPGSPLAPEVSPYNATVLHRIDITPRLSIFQVKPDDAVFSFTPGQFTVLGLLRSAPRTPESDPEEPAGEKASRLIRRAYSISSGSLDKGFLEFYISQVTNGELTPRLFLLQPGDRLFVGAKASGLFTLNQVPPDREILMIATGTGLAPYVSMLRTHAAGLAASGRRLAVLHGASFSWDLGYRGELETLQRHHPGFRYLPLISRPEEDPAWQGATGRITQWLEHLELAERLGFDPDPASTHIFLCGHPGMIEESMAILAGKGFTLGTRQEPGNLHTEKYW